MSAAPVSAGEDVTYARCMLPDDANFAGNVHGGEILKMVEHAGYIAATRHCNHCRKPGDGSSPVFASLARLETMDFLAPMLIGDVARLHAHVLYASSRSVEVEVLVWAERLGAAPSADNALKVTNRARLYYVPVRITSGDKGYPLQVETVPAPPVPGLSKEEEESGEERYNASKSAREEENADLDEWKEWSEVIGSEKKEEGSTQKLPTDAAQKRTVKDSATSLVQLVLPSDCYQGTSFCFGGVIMKLVDNAAGIVATRHCRSNVVTASFDCMNFLSPVRNGDLLHIEAVPSFASSRSLEIVVRVMAEDILTGVKRTTSHCRLIFVTLTEDGKVSQLPQLHVSGSAEMKRFAAGKSRYDERKKSRHQKQTL